MRKKVFIIGTFIAICIIVGVTIYSIYRYYAPPRLRKPYQTKTTTDDTLRIAFIGDSWAFIHKNHKCKIAQLLQDTLRRPVKVHSFGICGLTSKEIYENIFDNEDFKYFIFQRRYKYCYVSAGINDTYKKMSISYYQQSIDNIIQFLLFNYIHPIIQEVPDYDIIMSFERQEPSKKLLRRLSMMINNIPLDCKQIYRNALDKLIHEKNYENKVSIVRYKSWNSNKNKDQNSLYCSDRMHLNDKGYEALDIVIAKEILRQMTTEHGSGPLPKSDIDGN